VEKGIHPQQLKIICEHCGNLINGKSNYTRHIKICDSNPEKLPKKKISKRWWNNGIIES
jgi:hypothetical protein